MITDVAFYLVAVVSVVVTGISKSGFGGGLGVLSVPLLALVIPPSQAAAVLLPILCLMDLFNVWHYRHTWDAVNLRILVPSALVGVGIGTLTFRYFSEAHLRLLIGGIALLFVLFHLRSHHVAKPQRASVWRGGFWGLVAGFTSFGMHAGGPPATIYMLPQRLEKSLFVGTLVILFTVVNYVKLVPYSLLGQLDGDNLFTSLVLAPLAPVGVWLGIRLHRWIDERVFYTICYVALGVTGLKLLVDGFRGL